MEARTKVIAAVAIAVIIIAVAGGAYYFYYMRRPPAVWEVMPKTPMDTFVYAYPDEPITMDPAIAFDWGSLRCIRLMYERLVEYDGESITEFKGVLAERWEFLENGTVLRFHLRRGVKFHCGHELTAEDVKFSMERLLTLGLGPSYIFEPVIKEVRVVDTYTVDFVLTYPAPDMLERFAGQWGFYVVCKECVEKHATADDPWATEWMHDHECGTGPYKLVEWRHGEYQSFEAFDDYWRGWEGKHIRKVLFKWVKEPSTARMLLMKGEVDAAHMLTTEMFRDLVDNPVSGITVHVKPSMLTLYMFMPCQKPPFNNKYLRKAISYAYDYDALVDALGGFAKQLRGVLPSVMWGWDPECPMYERDLEKARHYMELAGYPDGLPEPIEVYYVVGDDTERKACEVLAASLADIGIEVRIVAVSWPSLEEMFTAGPTETVPYMFYWTPDWPHPWDWFYFMFHGDQWPTRLGYYNGMYYENDTVDALIDQLKTELHRDKAVELSHRIQRLIVDDAPCLFLVEIDYLLAMGEWVKGYWYNPMYVYTFPCYDMYKEVPGGGAAAGYYDDAPLALLDRPELLLVTPPSFI